MRSPVGLTPLCAGALLATSLCQSPALEFVLLSQDDFALYRIQMPLRQPVRVGQLSIQTDMVELTSVSSNVIYTFDRATNQLVALDLHTGSLLSVMALDQNIQSARRGFAISPAGTLYGVLPGMQLRTINPTSGQTAVVAPIAGAARVETLAFSPKGVLFASGSLDDDASSETLFTLDTATGVLSLVGNMAVADLDQMTFAQDGFLYGVDSRAGAADLYQINPATGEVRNLGSTGVIEVTGIVAVPDSSGMPGMQLVLARITVAIGDWVVPYE